MRVDAGGSSGVHVERRRRKPALADERRRHGQKPLTDEGDLAGEAQVSPDGRYIFFTSSRSKTRQVWRMDIDGSHPKRLTEGAGVPHFSLTPDGGQLIYNLWTRGIWKVSVEGG